MPANSLSGPPVRFVDVCHDAAAYCDEFALVEKQTWEGYRPYRYEQPAATAAATRALMALVKEAVELAARDEYPETYAALASALLDRFAAGYLPPEVETHASE